MSEPLTYADAVLARAGLRLRRPGARLDPNRPTVPEMLPLAHAVYQCCMTGCCLHVVLDDENIHDYFIERAEERALDGGHMLCLLVARGLLQMSFTQREKVARRCRYYEPVPTHTQPYLH